MNEIIVKGRPLPMHFGMKAINEFVKNSGFDFDDAVTTTNPIANMDSIVSLAVVGLNEGARRSGSDDRYTEDDVWDILDEEPRLILDISTIFMESVMPLTDRLGDIAKNGTRPAAKTPNRKK